LISALLLAASPAAAQLATSSRVQQLGGQPVQPTPTVAPTTGVFCIEDNDCDVLQRSHRSEHEWLRVAQRIHILLLYPLRFVSAATIAVASKRGDKLGFA